MDSFFGSFGNSNNYSSYEDKNDSLINFSNALNRSKHLLNESVANPNKSAINTPSRLIKSSALQQNSLLSNTISEPNLEQSNFTNYFLNFRK